MSHRVFFVMNCDVYMEAEVVVVVKLNPADPGGELVEQSRGSGFGKCKRRGRTGRCKQKISLNYQFVLAVLHDRNIP